MEMMLNSPHSLLGHKLSYPHQSTPLLNQPTNILHRLSLDLELEEKKTIVSQTTIKIQSIKTTFYSCIATLIYNLYLLTTKTLIFYQNSNIPSLSIMVFFLSFYQVLISIILMKIDHIDISSTKVFNKTEVDELIMRCFIEFLQTVFTLLSLSNMRLLSAVTIFFLSPIIRAYIVLKQKMDEIKKLDKICYCLSLIVCLIFFSQDCYVIDNENFRDTIKGTLYTIIATVLIALNAITEKKTCNEFHPYVILFVTGLLGVSFSPIMMSAACNEFKVGIGEFVLLCICGVCGFFSGYYNQKFTQMNLLLNKTSSNYSTIAMGYLLSIGVLDETVTIWDTVASLLSIYVNYQTKLRLEICENEDDL